jgi:hypothetical protein
MNPSHLKLFLALLWLVPGVVFLAFDLLTGQTHGLLFAGRRLPIAWVFLLLGAFNLLRWWVIRSKPYQPRSLFERRRGRRRRAADTEPDPHFRFDEPPAQAGSDER